MDSVLDFLEYERYFPDEPDSKLHIPWLYVTSWGFLPFGYLHLRMQMPLTAKLLAGCFLIAFLTYSYPQRRCEVVFFQDMLNIFKERPRWRGTRSHIIRTGRHLHHSVGRNAILALVVIFLRLYIFENGVATERVSPRFLETVRHRTTGFMKGLDCLSAYSRQDERNFMLYEALNCSKFSYSKGHGILRYVPAVQSVQTLKLRCLYPTGPVLEGSVSVRPKLTSDVSNGIRGDTSQLLHSCESVGLNCSNVLSVSYWPGRIYVILRKPRKTVLISLRSDTTPGTSATRETLYALQEGVNLKAVTRIALGVEASNKFGPCFRLGKTVETSPPVRSSYLRVNVWSLVGFMVLELFFGRALEMRMSEGWGPEEGLDIAEEGLGVFSMLDV